MEYRCRLYRKSDHGQNDRCFIDSDPLSSFDDILDKESSPFHDELSSKFLKEVYDISYTGSMHFEAFGVQYAIHHLSKDAKKGLMLLKNSKAGIYTDIEDDFGKARDYLLKFDEFDLLFAYSVERGESHPPFSYFRHLIVENFPFKGTYVPVTIFNGRYPDEKELVYQSGDWFELYHTPNGYISNGNFFTQFEYDWKRDLPQIKAYIDMRYKEKVMLAEYEKKENLFDIFEEPDYMKMEDTEEENAEIRPYKVINHLCGCMKREADSRRIAQMFFFYRKDGSVDLYHSCSVKYPDILEILTDQRYEFGESMEYVFALFIDVEEIVTGPCSLEETWFGAYFDKEPGYMELFDKDRALLEFAKQIPYVLSHMNLPLMGDRKLEESFKLL